MNEYVCKYRNGKHTTTEGSYAVFFREDAEYFVNGGLKLDKGYKVSIDKVKHILEDEGCNNSFDSPIEIEDSDADGSVCIFHAFPGWGNWCSTRLVHYFKTEQEAKEAIEARNCNTFKRVSNVSEATHFELDPFHWALYSKMGSMVEHDSIYNASSITKHVGTKFEIERVIESGTRVTSTKTNYFPTDKVKLYKQVDATEEELKALFGVPDEKPRDLSSFPGEVKIPSQDEDNKAALDAIVAKQKEQKLALKGATKMDNSNNNIIEDMVNNENIKQLVSETSQNLELVAGERLYENIDTAISDYVMGKLTWWQKISLSKKQKELLMLAAIYGLVHAIRTGAFGLFGKQVNHKSLDMIALACNYKIQTKVFAGFDTNIIKMLLTKPVVTES